KTGFVTKAIPQDGKGYVKLGGEEWSAISEDGSPIEENTKVTVLGVEGNKLIVKKSPINNA
ncbi:MAG TPA: NfeD family protein, partial [Candidatus Syntrophosphaera thermopropionivorans]|nr:NfeD family protein [Candidatus Syntrophosphaera thermopropionivorans]HQP83934.1 NfeD family protein [Candidatus Syntrophosphaera thermopropionivorans]